MISILSIPPNMKLTVEFGEGTLKLFNRIVTIYANQKEIKELMVDLDKSTTSLQDTVDKNPDPNPNN